MEYYAHFNDDAHIICFTCPLDISRDENLAAKTLFKIFYY